MGECEICGDEGASYYVLIEGAKLWVCGDCAKRGKIIARPAPAPPKFGKAAQSRAAASGPSTSKEVDIVADYADRIRNARQKMKIGSDVLAELVFEKQSFIDRIEAGKSLPPEALAKRLEKALGIKLFEEITYGENVSSKKKGGDLTLGDLVFVKKKKDE